MQVGANESFLTLRKVAPARRIVSDAKESIATTRLETDAVARDEPTPKVNIGSTVMASQHGGNASGKASETSIPIAISLAKQDLLRPLFVEKFTGRQPNDVGTSRLGP
jgi:hypothetical protein